MFNTNLARYDHKRMVILGPGVSVYDGARALEANHIGCILVADGERLLGIVTDRDLALRVVGYELDPRELMLRDVMSPGVVTLPATATEADAAKLMLAHRVRRIPLEEQGKVVGLVTLDDLIIHGFEPGTVARIVSAQLAAPSRLKEQGDVHPTSPTHESQDALPAPVKAERRHRARADASYHALLRRVMDETGLASMASAEAALDALLAGIIEQITPDETRQLLAQLPANLRERLSGVTRGPQHHVTRESIERAISSRLGLGEARAAQLVFRLGRALEGAVSAGELSDVKAQLPADLRGIFA